MSRPAPRAAPGKARKGGKVKPDDKSGDPKGDPAYTINHPDLLKKKPGFQMDDDIVDLDSEDEPEQLSILAEAEAGKGKTDFIMRTTPETIWMCDTEIKNAPMVRKIRRELGRDIRYKKIITFDDFRQVCLLAAEKGGGTLALDSSADIQSLCVREWLKDSGLKKVYPLSNYQYIHNRIEVLVNAIKDNGVILAMTAKLKDEWGKNAKGEDEPTGNRIVETYKKFPWECSVHLSIQWGIRDEQNSLRFRNHRVGKIKKNNYWGIDSDRQLQFGKPYLFDLSYPGIVKEIMEPWHPELDEDGEFTYGEYDGKRVILGGVKLNDEVMAKQIIKDATAHFNENPDGTPLKPKPEPEAETS